MLNYNLDPVIEKIRANKYVNVAIQSSDVKESADVCTYLQEKFSTTPNTNFYVIGDVLIGSCCTDIIASRRCNADYIIYLGEFCQSSIEVTVPISYVYNIVEFDSDFLSNKVETLLKDLDYTKLLLVYNAALHHRLPEICKTLLKLATHIYVAQCFDDNARHDAIGSRKQLAGRPVYKYIIDDSSCATILGEYELETNTNDILILFLNISGGCDGLRDTIALETSGCQYYELLVDSGDVLNLDGYGDKLRINRYKNIEKVKGASKIGIITLTKCLSGINRLRSEMHNLLKKSNKKCYVFSINHLTEAKLTNFPAIDIYCLLSCSHTALTLPAILSKHLVLPFELLVALGVIDWSVDYVFDFNILLKFIYAHAIIPDSGESDNDKEKSEIKKICGGTELSLYAKNFYDNLPHNKDRTFSGLDPLYNFDKESKIIRGSHGTASGYSHEYTHK
ncbi:conserved hypothetical protein [Theileria equi strain WA]|uniref:2-(3-amino-3-carboxypropyl)histidine synthase n=1 Tax=Theileria equi strain WA TaxID=1537102 RepID=L1LER1_THEEQ|nr:conserved hypothetical protein [Theileria equi strain WA]EKX73740.1 conserved hypothetical protein [Theileria equi strain WA]|eukprot:XP_004833192.1 conserved hypothetical protein [Theileria equi strain WA]